MKMTANVMNIMFPGKFNPKTDKWCDYKELVQGVRRDYTTTTRTRLIEKEGYDVRGRVTNVSGQSSDFP